MATDWKNIADHKFSSDAPPAHWPKDVRPISVEGLSLLGIGVDNRLYFDGMQLEFSKTVKLTWWQTALATITAFSALIAAVATILPYFGIKS